MIGSGFRDSPFDHAVDAAIHTRIRDDILTMLMERYHFIFSQEGDQFQMLRHCDMCGAKVVRRRPALTEDRDVDKCFLQMSQAFKPWRELVLACQCDEPSVREIRETIEEMDGPSYAELLAEMAKEPVPFDEYDRAPWACKR
jgi:hypothetical protein